MYDMLENAKFIPNILKPYTTEEKQFVSLCHFLKTNSYILIGFHICNKWPTSIKPMKYK